MDKYLNNYLDLLGGLKGGAKVTFITGNVKKLEELKCKEIKSLLFDKYLKDCK